MNIPIGQYVALLGRYLRPQRTRVVIMAVLLLSSIGLQAANPQLIRLFIDGATSGASSERLVAIALVFIVLALATQALGVAATYFSEGVGWTATNALRTDLVAHCLALDMSFHKTRTPGEMIQRIDGDVDALSNFFSQFVIYVVGNIALLCAVLVLLFLEDWTVGLGLSLFAVIALTVLVRLRSFAVPHWAALREESAQLYGFVGESLWATEDVRGNGAAAYVMRTFNERLRRLLPVQMRSGLAGAAMWMSSLMVFTLGNAVAFLLAYHLYRAEALSIGSVYLIFHYTELLRRPVDQIRAQIEDLQGASASIARVDSLLNRKPRIADGPGAPIPDGALRLELRDVSFSYEPNEPVLQDVQIDLRPGRALGLLGRTGSGKTTLARLFLRFYDPDTGEIALGGVPVQELRLPELRRRVGMVTQDVQIFNASVRDNLTFFDQSFADGRLLAVLEEVGLGGWLQSLPAGLDTELDSAGANLSAGEAQLLAFARIYLTDPGLVVLDEASSRLDPATEQRIARAIDRLLRNRTAIVIAHRLATIERVDEIAVLEHGRIVEHGERAALARDPNSRFHALQELAEDAASP